jgi:ankyrin repeat protein
MSVPPRAARVLPAAPNLEQQKKQARELLDAARAGDPVALARIRDFHPRLGGTPVIPAALSLSDAQLVLAREYGFPSWPKFKAQIESLTRQIITQAFVRDPQYYEDRAAGLLEVLPDGAAATMDQVRTWHPGFAGASDDELREAGRTGRFTIEDARLVYAREHGCSTWARLVQHLSRLGSGKQREPFMEMLEKGKAGDWAGVGEVLRRHPELVRARGTNGNSLLNLASSMTSASAGARCRTGKEPADLGRLDPVRLLLAAGADPNQPNDRGWTPVHQAAYSNDPEMLSLLLKSGGDVRREAHGSGGTPLAVSLFWGYRESAEILAMVLVVPANLRIAAGLGRVDLVERCFTSQGSLTAEAIGSRGFYRPHSGFPRWRPSPDPQEVLDEALVWAAKADRIEVMPLLVRRGARVGADPYRGTPLIWAAANGRQRALEWLLDHGAEVNQRATFGGPGHGDGVTALHLAAQNGRREVVEYLLSRGGDPRIKDNLYGGPPHGWAFHAGHRELGRFLEGVAGTQSPPT